MFSDTIVEAPKHVVCEMEVNTQKKEAISTQRQLIIPEVIKEQPRRPPLKSMTKQAIIVKSHRLLRIPDVHVNNKPIIKACAEWVDLKDKSGHGFYIIRHNSSIGFLQSINAIGKFLNNSTNFTLEEESKILL